MTGEYGKLSIDSFPLHKQIGYQSMYLVHGLIRRDGDEVRRQEVMTSPDSNITSVVTYISGPYAMQLSRPVYLLLAFFLRVHRSASINSSKPICRQIRSCVKQSDTPPKKDTFSKKLRQIILVFAYRRAVGVCISEDPL